MDELSDAGCPAATEGVEMERRRAEMHRRIMAARHAARPPHDEEDEEPAMPRTPA
jgi:hypothetical protein